MEARSLLRREMPLARLTLAAGLALCTSFLLVAALFLIRRLAGAFATTLTPAAFTGGAFLLLGVAAMARIAGTRLLARRGKLGLRLAFLILPAVALTMMIWTMTSASISVLSLALIWTFVAVEEGTWCLVFLWRRPLRAETQTAQERVATSIDEQAAYTASVIDDPEFVPSNVVQQFTRVRTENGGESISGVLRGIFAAGERNQNLHMAFCPPLAAVPELSFEQVAGPSATIKVGQVESFGARLEVRLDAAAKEYAQILVEFAACVPST